MRADKKKNKNVCEWCLKESGGSANNFRKKHRKTWPKDKRSNYNSFHFKQYSIFFYLMHMDFLTRSINVTVERIYCPIPYIRLLPKYFFANGRISSSPMLRLLGLLFFFSLSPILQCSKLNQPEHASNKSKLFILHFCWMEIRAEFHKWLISIIHPKWQVPWKILLFLTCRNLHGSNNLRCKLKGKTIAQRNWSHRVTHNNHLKSLFRALLDTDYWEREIVRGSAG